MACRPYNTGRCLLLRLFNPSKLWGSLHTRPFFAHIDNNGHGTKPFELPSADPDYHRQFMRCYNIPEFMHGPVTTKPQTFAEILKGEGTPVKYVQKLTKSQ